MSLNVPYLKEQEYIGSEWFPRYYAFYEMKGVGHAPGGPPGVPCHLMCLIIRNKNIHGLGRVF